MILSAIVLLASCKPGGRTSVVYTESAKGDLVETLFDTPVADPYRWLEDDMSAETANWVKRQNEVTFGYLDQTPYRTEIKERLTAMWNYERFGAPFKYGDYTYFFRNDGLQNQSVQYRQKDGGEMELFLDQNRFSEDGTTSLGEIGFTKDGSLLAANCRSWQAMVPVPLSVKPLRRWLTFSDSRYGTWVLRN